MNDTVAPYLTLIIPCFNEAQRLPRSLPVLLAYLQQQAYSWELLFIDDGSTDGTVELLRQQAGSEPRLRVTRLGKNMGKGNALKAGFREAAGQFIFFSDADLSTPITALADALPLLEQGSHLVYADRHMAGAVLRGYNPLRMLMSRSFNLLARRLLLPGVTDTQCGCKGVRREIVPAILDRLTVGGFAFDVEFMVIAREQRLLLRGFPVTWDNVHASKVKPFTDALGMFASLLEIRKKQRRGDYR